MMGSKQPNSGRKGVSTVVGMVFFLLIMLAALNLVLWQFVQMDAYQQTVNQRNQLEWERQNEALEITGLSLTESNALNVSVANKGAVMTHLVDMWVSEYNGTTPERQRVFPISYYVNLGETIMNVTVDETFTPLRTYKVDIVSERGNIESYTLYPASAVRLRVNTIVVPQNPLNNTDITVLVVITNNETKVNTVQEVTPYLTVNTTGGATAALKSGPTPASVSFLQRGGSAFFQYTYTVYGDTDDQLIFNGSYVGAPQGDFALAESTIIQTGVSEETVQEIVTTILVEELGPSGLDFDSFVYDEVDVAGVDWTGGWTVPKGVNIVFRMNMTNNDPDNRTIYLSEYSVFTCWVRTTSSIAEFYIIDPNYETSGAITAYTDYSVSLPPGVVTSLYFGADDAGDYQKQKLGSEGTYFTVVILYGKYDSPTSEDYYSQSIPFLGLYAPS